jgi:SWI/SNF-related matrix-associated actin-dependent regulator 1 of chromatin subfamily A
MVDLTKLKNRNTLEKIRSYNGTNEHILKIKNKLEREGFFVLTPNQIQYITDNFDREPTTINKVVDITPYLGEQLKEKYELKNIPERVFVETLLADSEKSYHVKGKLYKNQKESILFYIPKTQILTDMFYEPYEDLEVNFDSVNKINKKNRSLFPHQENAVKFLLKKDKSILSDDMGLGKTKSAIAAALLSGAEKILVICPANAKINWFREITEYIDEEYVTIVKSGFWQPKFFTIINYDILNRFHEIEDKRKKTEPKSYINEEKFDLLIVDEAHMIKNKGSIRGKVVAQISENIEKIWLLTGTPIANRPMDYYNLLKVCNIPVADNFQHFAYRYCAAKSFNKKLASGKIKRIWLTDGASNLEELHQKTKNYILRRKKEDHLDLPPKIISPFYLDLENRKGYKEAFDDYLFWLEVEGKKLGAGRQMVEMGVLRKFISKEKVPMTVDMVHNFLDQSDDKKIIVFTVFTDSLKELKKEFGDLAVCHNGEMSDKEKQKSIDEFQNNPKIRVFIGNIISAGSAITLTASDTTIFHDLDFSASNHQQAEDRNYRISQDKTVNVYYPIFQDTIEEKIFELLEKKKYISSTILGEKNNEYSILSDLILSLGTNT